MTALGVMDCETCDYHSTVAELEPWVDKLRVQYQERFYTGHSTGHAHIALMDAEGVLATARRTGHYCGKIEDAVCHDVCHSASPLPCVPPVCRPNPAP